MRTKTTLSFPNVYHRSNCITCNMDRRSKLIQLNKYEILQLNAKVLEEPFSEQLARTGIVLR